MSVYDSNIANISICKLFSDDDTNLVLKMLSDENKIILISS